MLKFDLRGILFVILFLQIEWSEAVGFAIPILCGLAIFTGTEVKNKTLSARGFLIKILYVSGLCPMVYHILKVLNLGWNIEITLFLVTVLSDLIVTHGVPMAGNWLISFFKSIINKNNGKNE